MSLKISPGSFRNAHPDLWESAQTQSKRLWNLQNILLAEFPEYYKQLPDSLEHYLQLRSLFACVEGLWVRLARRYRAVYNALEVPYEQAHDAVRELESLLKEIQAMPLESFVQRTEGGLLQLEDLMKQFSERLDSGIFDPTLSDSYPKEVTVGCNLEKDVIKQKLLAIRQRNMMFFDTDDEFADFVIHPYAVINNYEGRLSYEGAYSEQYLRALKEGKKFVIMKGSLDSAVNRRKVVSKRVLVPKELGSTRQDVCVSLVVDNLSNGIFDL
jgi:5-formyltetrahydrofolate cyclo-ligase